MKEEEHMKYFKKATTATIGALALGALAACAATPTAKSGFLSDYSKLRPDPKIEGQLSYRNPSKKVTAYKKFLIDPVVVQLAPNAKGKTLDPGDLKKLTDFFRNEAVKALSKRYQVVSKPGPGVLYIRAALTDVEVTNPMLNIHPGTKMTGAGLGGASMEAEAFDSVTMERIVAVVETQKGSRLSMSAGLSKFGHAKEVMKGWVERFVKRLDAANSGKQRR